MKGLFLLLVSTVLSHCYIIDHKESTKDIDGVILTLYDGYAPRIARPRFSNGKRVLKESDVENTYSLHNYRELKRLSNEQVKDGGRIVLMKLPRDEEEMNNKKQTEIWGRRHRYRFLIKRPTREEIEENEIKSIPYHDMSERSGGKQIDVPSERLGGKRQFFEEMFGKKEFAPSERFGGKRQHIAERFGKKEPAPSERFGGKRQHIAERFGKKVSFPSERFGGKREYLVPVRERFLGKKEISENDNLETIGESEDGIEIPERYSDKRENSTPRAERFGNIHVQNDAETNNDQSRWVRFGKEIKKDAPPRWSRFGREIEVIVVDENDKVTS